MLYHKLNQIIDLNHHFNSTSNRMLLVYSLELHTGSLDLFLRQETN